MRCDEILCDICGASNARLQNARRLDSTRKRDTGPRVPVPPAGRPAARPHAALRSEHMHSATERTGGREESKRRVHYNEMRWCARRILCNETK